MTAAMDLRHGLIDALPKKNRSDSPSRRQESRGQAAKLISVLIEIIVCH
jgi:hypothetical protein